MYLQSIYLVNDNKLMPYTTMGVFRRGVFRPWAYCAMPHLWVASIVKLHRKVSKIEAWAPPFGSCALGLITQRVCSVRIFQACTRFGRKIGPNLREDLFFLLFTEFWAKNRIAF